LLLDFLAGAFFVGADAFAASARFSAQRLLVASLIALRPAALSFRFALGATAWADEGCPSASPLILAHLAFCCHSSTSRGADLPFTHRRSGLRPRFRAATTQQLPQFVNLGVNPSFLRLEAFDGGVDDFGSQLLGWHVNGRSKYSSVETILHLAPVNRDKWDGECGYEV